MSYIRTSIMLFLAFGAWIYTLSANAETQAFKCTAEDGKISYLDTRPSTGCATIEIVRINVGRGTVDASDEDNEGSAIDKEVAEKKAAIKKDCETRKKDLETLKTKTFVQTKNTDGTVHTLTPEELVERKNQLESYISTMCGG